MTWIVIAFIFDYDLEQERVLVKVTLYPDALLITGPAKRQDKSDNGCGYEI